MATTKKDSKEAQVVRVKVRVNLNGIGTVELDGVLVENSGIEVQWPLTNRALLLKDLPKVDPKGTEAGFWFLE